MFPFAVLPPSIVAGKEVIRKVCCASNDTILLTSRGDVYVSGQNRIGELGVGDTNPRYDVWELVMRDAAHIAAVKERLYILKKSGDVYSVDGSNTWQKITTWDSAGDLSNGNIRDVISDTENIFIWKTDNSLWYMGNNSRGQGNTGNTTATTSMRLHTSDVARVSASGDTLVVLKTDGFLWGCGDNTRGIMGTSSNYTALTRMFGSHADGGTIADFAVTAKGTALLVRYSDGKYRTRGLNIGQLPSGTASPGSTLTEVPEGHTPGNGSEPLLPHNPCLLTSGTYPSYSANMFYYTGGEIYSIGSATGYLTGVNKSSGTLTSWTNVDSSSTRIENLKGMAFGMGWVLAYSEDSIIYWGGVGDSSVIPVPGFVQSGRPQYQAMSVKLPVEFKA